MRVLLSVFGFIGVLFGLYVFANAKSAVHEIEGLISLVFAAVCVGSAVIAGYLERVTQELRRSSTQPAPQWNAQLPQHPPQYAMMPPPGQPPGPPFNQR